MKGSIHSDQTCPICGSRFKSQEPKGLFCPEHPHQTPTRFVVRYGKITKRFNTYPAAHQFLTGLRFQDGSGQFDARDYQVKGKPLAFDKLADEWLDLKAKQIKKQSLSSLACGIRRAQKSWGDGNIKSIKYAQLEDFMSAYDGAVKSKANALAALKQFWAWATDRYGIEPIKKWPTIGVVEMSFRNTVDLQTQDAILDEIKKDEPFKVWLAMKWLSTYIAIRPGEMISLKEKHAERGRGVLIFPHPKEKRPKIIPLTDDDKKLLASVPHYIDPEAPFFRHEGRRSGITAGSPFGPNHLYRAWMRACKKLKIKGVGLYGGTKHSTAMGVRQSATFEEVRLMTGHSTNKAFERYFRTEGAALANLYSKRQTIIDTDNELITTFRLSPESKVIDFTK